MEFSSSCTKSRNISKMPSRTMGSSPLVASSKIKSFGWCAKAAARESFAFMPFEKDFIFFAAGRDNLFSRSKK